MDSACSVCRRVIRLAAASPHYAAAVTSLRNFDWYSWCLLFCGQWWKSKHQVPGSI